MRSPAIDHESPFEEKTASDLREAVLAAVLSGAQGVRTRDLLQMKCLDVNRRRIRRAVAELVETGQLAYAYHHGCSYLQRGWDRPVRISRRVTIKPPWVTGPSEPGDIVIDMTPGAAFGGGDHPTTILSVQAIEFCTDQKGVWPRQSEALDIGTGTGVLAMVSVCMGIRQAMAIDIDPSALAEAKTNAAANGLTSRIQVTDQPLELISTSFDLITANLRFPTLARLIPFFKDRLKAGAFLVVSGLREEEAAAMRETGISLALFPVWQRKEQDWAGLVFQKKD